MRIGSKHSEKTKKHWSKIRKGIRNGIKGEFKKGHVPWIKTHGHSEKSKLKLSIAKKGKKLYPNGRPEFSEQWRKNISEAGMGRIPWNKGKKLSQEHILNLSKSHFKATTKINEQIRSHFKYRLWRSDVFQRDSYTCQECGILRIGIEADHIKKLASIIEEYKLKTLEEALNCEELWNINNGRTLCRPCHSKTPTYGNKN